MSALSASARSIRDLIPCPNHMIPAWLACVSFALGQPEVVAAFRAETGNTFEPGKTPLDRLIDQASGVELEFLTSFIGWVNHNIWGEEAPKKKRRGNATPRFFDSSEI